MTARRLPGAGQPNLLLRAAVRLRDRRARQRVPLLRAHRRHLRRRPHRVPRRPPRQGSSRLTADLIDYGNSVIERILFTLKQGSFVAGDLEALSSHACCLERLVELNEFLVELESL